MPIEFVEKGHKYYKDGVEIPSVSELTRFISKEIYGNANLEAAEAAKERGTLVHAATEEMDRIGSVEVPDYLEGYLMAYARFISDYKPFWWMSEEIVYSENWNYAGRVDRFGTLKTGENILLDIKTTKRIGKKEKVLYSTQLGFYDMAIKEMSEHKIDGIAILKLSENGTYKLINVEPHRGLMRACYQLHESLNTKKKIKDYIA